VSGWFADDRALSLQRVRPLATEPFYIIAHRGGGRNSDRLLRSENSVEMVRYAEVLGANAVEIDIKRTRDDHLIVFHDETFSPRTVQGSFLLGDVNEFSLHDIQRYGRLVHGERIPTLDEMLTAIIDSTSLELVWLDVKDAEATDAIIAAQERAIGRAQQKGRRIELVFGIPTEDVLRAYYASPRANRAPVLLELDAAHIENLPSCSIWAPRWTNGISQGQVDEMHARGIKVVTWTLDVREYMQQFVRDVRLDGILTNYPSLLCGMYYLL
jgi:glycerophosphoryl diester phosphodiesterase